MARGLAKAHTAGVIHRDLKPGNIFLAERDGGARVAKILDFGVSKRRTPDDMVVVDGDEEFATAMGITLGTPQYMSPEQAQGRPDLDSRADVWSLAATLYEALSGQSPYEGGSPAEVMMRVVREDPRPLAVVAPWVPAALCEVVDAGLSRDRDERTPDAATFAEALAVAARVTPAPVTIPCPPPVVEPFEIEPPSSAGSRVQFFRREAIRDPAACTPLSPWKWPT